MFRPRDVGWLRRRLLAWYAQRRRDLPWCRTDDPYRIWVAEVLLQQTRVATALPYYERLLRAFPTVQHLARAPLSRVLKLWEGLGYYTRARNLHEAARQIVERRGGQFPQTPDEWMRLPGVGRYTAGAVCAAAFGVRAPVVDGNVKRVLCRLLALAEPVDTAAAQRLLWETAGRLVPADAPGEFNQALMELGSLVCLRRAPRCGECPLRGMCRAAAGGHPERFPVRSPRRGRPHHEIVVAAIRRRGRYLIGRRPPVGLLGGLWEFPGGKVGDGESHAAALRRECREELGVSVRVGPHVATVRHAYSHFSVRLHVYLCTLVRGEPQARFHTALRWVPAGRFGDYAFPAANHKFLRRLRPEAVRALLNGR